MVSTGSLAAFTLAAALLALTPGIDTALVVRTSVARGRGAAAGAAVGIGVGCLCWGAAVAAGLGALVAASPLAFGLLQWAGAAYLVWLGVGLLRGRGRGERGDAADAPALAVGGSLRTGLLTNLLNPKMAVFYATFLPQFTPAGVNVFAYTLLLVSIHVALAGAWFALLIVSTDRVAPVLRSPRVTRAIDRVTGCAFVGFAARLALAAR